MIPTLEADGFAWKLAEEVRAPLEALRTAAMELGESEMAHRRRGKVFALRNATIGNNAIAAFAHSETVRAIVRDALGADALLIRSIVFDKVPGANWGVPWHQDLNIAVVERRDTPGYGPWSVKDGVPHVEPPPRILERMVTLRLHLDDCGAENGALEVLRGSHAHGRFNDDDIDAHLRSGERALCTCAAGDILLMKPLLLHRSSPATSPAHRRVLHMEFCAAPLDGGLEWYHEGK